MPSYYSSVGRDPRGDGYIAVISIGHPNCGDDHVIVCDVTRCRTVQEGQAWAKRQLDDPEWHKRAEAAEAERTQIEGGCNDD